MIKKLKKVIIIISILLVSYLLALNSFEGYRSMWIFGYFHNYIFHLPIYIKEGTWEYSNNNVELYFVIDDIDKKMDEGRYINKCFFYNKEKGIDYNNYVVMFVYNDWNAGSILVSEQEYKDKYNFSELNMTSDIVFLADFKYKRNKDIMCYNLKNYDGLWSGPEEFTLQKVK